MWDGICETENYENYEDKKDIEAIIDEVDKVAPVPLTSAKAPVV